ncbi:MAG: hypothetical protein QW650_03715 [Thermofilum sp.]
MHHTTFVLDSVEATARGLEELGGGLVQKGVLVACPTPMSAPDRAWELSWSSSPLSASL